MNYETVCGLEIHTELLTDTKIFCACSTAFGAAPNSQCCPVCTGMPGALPVLNRRVVEFAVRCGLALHCTVTEYTRFDRKNYFYPDLPRAYQISQLYLPICRNGWVEINDSRNGGKKRVRIHEIHMEEDAGKLLHEGNRTLINYNRAGVPLLEIVSEPDLANGTEAAEYTERLREILLYCGISDCKMQEGSLRADVNVSVREQGSAALGIRTEMKNLSSFRAIRAAVDGEAVRQIALIEKGGRIVQETRRFDEKAQCSYPMRSKEEAQDYKYFPEPDLPPLVISEAYIESVREALPELPEERRARYVSLGLTPYDAEVLCAEPALCRLFEETLKLTGLPKETANWVLGEALALRNDGAVTPALLGEVIRLFSEKRITRAAAKETLAACVKSGEKPQAYIKAHQLAAVNDERLTEETAAAVLAENPKAVEEYRNGKEKSLNFLVGQCMKKLKGKASPDIVRAALLRKIKK